MSKPLPRTRTTKPQRGLWSWLASLLLIVAVASAGCRPSAPGGPATQAPVQPTPTQAGSGAKPMPVLLVKDDGRALAPQVMSIQPGPGQEIPDNGEIRIVFDQAMDPERTAQALSVSSADASGVQTENVPGKVQWMDPQTLTFTPEGNLQGGAIYLVRVGEDAVSTQGVNLREPLSYSFTAVDELVVSQVFPAEGTQDVSVDAVITVIFNRPVAPLVISEEQRNLPDPLQIEPSVEGQGEWVNTSAYTFHPAKPLVAGMTYTVVVPAGLMDASGDSQLAQNVSWQFTTQAPKIASFELLPDVVNPENERPGVRLDASFAVSFLQPMDPQSTEAATTLTSSQGEAVTLETQWNEDWTRMVLTPTQQLALGTNYHLTVAETAQAAVQGNLEGGLDWSFSTVPPPAILSVMPDQGTTQPSFDPTLIIRFASPMRIDSVKSRIQITPAPEEPVNWWYNDWDNSLIAYVLKPSTNYQITFQPGMEDIYGNTISTGRTVSFRTAPRQPQANLQMPYLPAMMRAGDAGAQSFYIRFVNIDSYSLQLYRLEPAEFASIISGRISQWEYSPAEANLVWQDQGSGRAGLDEWVLEEFSPRLPDGGLLPTGFYFLGLDTPAVESGSRFDDTRLVMVNTANLTFKTSAKQTVVWMTDLNSGEPVEGVPVTILDTTFQEIGSGTTGPDGLLSIDVPYNIDSNIRFTMAGSPDSAVFGFASSDWGSDVPTYEFGIYGSYFSPPDQAVGYVYTERPIYRPGQPVYFKGIVRVDDDLDYSLPDQGQVQVTIQDFQEIIYDQTLPLSEFGTFDGELLLDPEAALGYYTLQVSYPGSPTVIGEVSFNVAEYVRPEFRVDVSAEPADVLAGQEFTARVSAEYYSGGPVGDAAVTWTLSAEPFYFNPGGDYSSYSFTDFEEDLYYRDQFIYGPPSPMVIATGIDRTGADGKLVLSLPADLSESQTGQTLTFEAMTTDFSQNLVSGRASVVAHLSQVYPGVRSQSYVGQVGKEQTFELVALDWNGKPISGQNLNIEIVERRWYSVQEQDASGRLTWTSNVEEIPVTSFTDIVTDPRGEATVSFTPEKGGTYAARVRARDAGGREGRASAYMWVAGEEYIPWRQTNDHSFDLVADKDEYLPGETASLLIASPFQGTAYALVTVERGKVRQEEVVRLDNNSTLYELEITPDMAPNAYVSVLVVKGVDETNPRPGFKMGIVQLHVDRSSYELQVQVMPDRPTAGPGENVVYTISTKDAKGNPVSAELSLGLSDLATLSLMDPNSAPVLDYFYSNRNLNVWTTMPLALSIEDYNADIQASIPPEGGGMGSGGGKGGGEFGVVEVRQDFPDTAFWAAHVVTNQNGEATVAVRLPDNLTTWRMDARAVTLDSQVGQTFEDIISTRPLLIRPQTPRFFVAGDQATLGAAVHNNTGQDLQLNVSLEASGLTLAGPSSQTVSIANGQQALVTWQGTVDMQAGRVDLLFRAEGGGFSDATRPTIGTLDGQGLPVYRYEAHETVGTSGQLTAGGTEIEAIRLPEGMEVQEGKLNISVSPSLAAGMTEGLRYLESYPYECVEQTISRFLPNVITTRALKTAGLSDPNLEGNLADEVNKVLQRLYNWQNPDGGWSWWPSSNQENPKSDPLTSAYAVLGLLEARDAGYTVSEAVFERALGYISGQVRPMASLTEPSKANLQAFILYVLARSGAPDVSKTVQLYEQRQTLSIYASAFLAQTLALVDPADPRVDTILSDLASQAITSSTGAHWEEAVPDRMNWNTDTRTTAIVLSALSSLDAQNPLNANAVRWLMSHRTQGHWEGTQETAWTLMALTNWMAASGELDPNYDWGVAVNGETLLSGTANPDSLRETQSLQVDVQQLLRGEANRLAVARTEGRGNLYYTAFMDLALPVSQVQALDQGIMVSRSYYPISTLEADERFQNPISEAQQGDLVLVRMTLVAPAALHYVVVDDPLPAGLEAVDQSLKTSPQTSVPPDYQWDEMFSNGWAWWYFNHVQLRDEKVVLSADYLPAGTYVYTYLARATTPGTYQVIPTVAQEFYFPDVYGRGEGSQFVVNP